MPNNNTMLDALLRSAQAFAAVMRGALTPGQYPEAIKKSIVIDAPQFNGSYFFIDVKVGGENAKMTGAFEYGSGLHRTRGAPSLYPITAGDKGYLAFPISRWPKYVPPPNVSVAKFPGAISRKDFVMHPGIAARPFVRPSIEESKGEVRKLLGAGFKAMIMDGVAPVTIIEVK